MSYPPTLPGMYWPTEEPFKPLVSSRGDITLASILFGWTLGFSYFVGCHCLRETMRSARKFSTYIILIWTELIACQLFAIMVWLYMYEVLKPSFWFYFFLLVVWGLQLQCLLQIIVNRLCVILPDRNTRNWLRFGTAGLILIINIAVFIVWMPAQMQISRHWERVNLIWDRCEKCIYLVVDGALNLYFIRAVKQRLVGYGLKKYEKLIAYNIRIMSVSILMDVLIIGMMSLPNPFVYTAFHPVAYIVKLNIEMAMSNLIVKVARDTGITDISLREASGATDSAPGRIHVTTHREHFIDTDTGKVDPPPPFEPVSVELNNMDGTAKGWQEGDNQDKTDSLHSQDTIAKNRMMVV